MIILGIVTLICMFTDITDVRADPGNGTGLKGDYYDSIDFSDHVLTRTDATINFNWRNSSPSPSIKRNTFSIRWTGQVEPLYSETYTFKTKFDNGVRLWVNGQKIIDNWTGEGAQIETGTIALTAGQKYDLQLEYMEGSGRAKIKLYWSSASQQNTIVPQLQLYPPAEGGLAFFKTQTYQAEDFTAMRDIKVSSSGDWYTGNGYAKFDAEGSYVEWSNVDVSESGEYLLTFYYANKGTLAELSINGRRVVNMRLYITKGQTTADTFKVMASLEAGDNSVRVTAESGGPYLDKMKVSAIDQPVSRLLGSLTAVADHLHGSNQLTSAKLEDHKSTIDTNMAVLAADETLITRAFEIVQAYESSHGPMFMNDATSNSWERDDFVPDIHTTTLSVMQGIVDNVYVGEKVNTHQGLLDGLWFESSQHFPGPVTAIPDPGMAHTATIDASFPDTFGPLIHHENKPARKPTGTYLAPGSIATVTVPASLVGKGYQIRVGAHSSNFSNRPRVLRLDRSTTLFEIESRKTKIANPLGGGVYIEVPYLADGGVVEIKIKNVVLSPYFSMKPFHTTTVDDWQNIERYHGAPWADFQTEKFLMQVPTSWIYNYDDPSQALRDWDAAADAVSDLMGTPRIRGKEMFYMQPDVLIRAKVFAPGYPQVNTKTKPGKDYGGNHQHYFLTGPQNSPYYELHESGHGQRFQKFPGEQESAVNLLYVAVMNQKFGMDLDEAFINGLGAKTDFKTLANTALFWINSESFIMEQSMSSGEMKYQRRGHARYVEIARLFGWESLDAYWYSINKDYERGKNIDTSVDGLILRMSKAVGVDVTPLLHFWGRQPDDYDSLQTAIDKAGLPRSRKIYDLLVEYQASVLSNKAAFRTFALNWWQEVPVSDDPTTTKGYHAALWNDYNRKRASKLRAVIQRIIDQYFPKGAPKPTDDGYTGAGGADTGGNPTITALELEIISGGGVNSTAGETDNGNTAGGNDSGGDAGTGTKVAFIGDTGADGNFQDVLDLIKAEGAEITIVSGDTSYSTSKDDAWDEMVRDTLGSQDPALIAAGNHDYDDSDWGTIRSLGLDRIDQNPDVQCAGDYGQKMTCTYNNLYFVLSSIGSQGSDSGNEAYIRDSLESAPEGMWRFCVWHKNQRNLQPGGKGNEIGWTAYEDCREQGAILATAHEHSYSRTHLLSDMSEQTLVSTASDFELTEGRSFVFVTGLGGASIRNQKRDGDYWAKIYTSDQGARYGALFGTFYADRAEFYFKNISGEIIDRFTVRKGY